MNPPRSFALELQTPRLRLRPLRRDDAAALLAIFADARVMRYWSTPPWTDIAQAHELIETDLHGLPLGKHLRLGIERVADGTLLGHCSLFALNEASRRAEVGYGMGHPFWGQGYMHEALRALLAWTFDALDLNRVEADIDPRNTGSARTLQRLGFRQEGLLRERWIVAGERSDTALWGLLRADWPPS